MAKIVDITDKLTFDENPYIKIKDKQYEVNADAETILKVMQLLSNGGEQNLDDIMHSYELLFDKETRKSISSLRLKIKDLMQVIEEAITLASGQEGDDKQGEILTHTTT